MIIGVTGFFVLLTLFKSLHFTKKTGGIDLRIRTVGARLLTTEHSPYFYKWKPSDGEYFLNPSDRANSYVNGNVVTPAMLYLVYPVTWQNYSTVRILWTFIQYLLAGLTMFLLFYKNKKHDSLIPAYAVIIGLLCTDIWLLNIERGQIYIFYTFLFSLMFSLYTSNTRSGILLSGVIAGLFIFFRPFSAVIPILFLLDGNKKWLIGCFAGFVFGCIVFVLPGITIWVDYFEAMNMYADQYINPNPILTNATDFPKSGIIEGTNNLDRIQDFNISKLDIVYNYLVKLGIVVSQIHLYIFYGSLSTLLLVKFFRPGIKRTPQTLFILAFLLYILAEFFVTVERGNYNIIQWLFPLSIILSYVKPAHHIFILIVTGLLMLHNFPFVFPYQAAFAELIFIASILYFVFAGLAQVEKGDAHKP